MGDDRSLDGSIRERIDACRPDSDDLQLPALAMLAYQVEHDPTVNRHLVQVQRIDKHIQTAVHMMPVPDGLRSRLVAAIDRQPVVRSEILASSAVPTARRRWAWISASVAATLLIGVGGLVGWSLRAPRTADVVMLADAWESKLGDRWRPIADAPHAFPVPRQLAIVPRGWQPMAFFQSYRGVVYNLLSSDHGRAVLFVVDVQPHGELPSSPPLTPQHSSNGQSVAAWFAGNRMCLLVLKGDERLYHRLIRVSAPVLARLRPLPLPHNS